MKKFKKIGEIYQERLKNHETTPPDDVWQNISAALPEKKKRKVLPLWYKLSGVAAALILLITIFNAPWQSTSVPDASSVSIQQQKSSYEIDATSTAFEEQMLRTTIILRSLIWDTKNNPVITPSEEKTRLSQRFDFRQQIRFSEVLRDSGNEVITKPNLEDYTFSEFLRQNSETQKEPEETEALAQITEPDLFSNENEPDETNEEQSSFNKRFSISTTAAAVYFSNSGNTNSMNEQAGNSAEVSMAYGVNLAYQVSDKVKIRTGVNKVDVGSTTRSIDYTAFAAPNSFVNDENAVPIASPEAEPLQQNLGFIEIPMEIEYSLINKKLGLNLIAGASTLLLNEDMTSANTAATTALPGETNSFNSTGFSANVGMGLDYNISSQFQLNLEPMFKYQLTTFNNTSGLNPYYFGIYTGLSYKF